MENLVGYWPNLSRAYEIALLGDFTITILFDEKYPKGLKDYQLLKEFFKGVKFVEEGNLTVQICKPDYDKDYSIFETLTDIHNRVNFKVKNKYPSGFKTSSCKDLLKKANDKLDFSITDNKNIIEIAKIIAMLDDSEKIEIQHLAESIHYNSYDEEDNLINPERDNEKLLKKQCDWLKINTSLSDDEIKSFFTFFKKNYNERNK